MRLPVALLAVVLVSALGGCGSEPSSESGAEEVVSRPAPSAELSCPARLPVGPDPDGYGFGSSEEATEPPQLPRPDQAWTCEYLPVDTGVNDNGASYEWVRQGTEAVVGPKRLGDLAAALAEVAPFPDDERMCTDDLGPRWLLAYTHGHERIEVVVDGFGCRNVRVPDEDGAAPGVLDGGAALLSAVGVGSQR
jgi:hypothetical protein